MQLPISITSMSGTIDLFNFPPHFFPSGAELEEVAASGRLITSAEWRTTVSHVTEQGAGDAAIVK